ncbi:hypothetical protein TVAG_404310 [Trichomonas vaginalis G3]|uniref:Uncharacterized protein n=1 Tax=Trichomonas vaginalis (strain ATCC PRA-98 / G3) TaxID=412133 RepID=A2EGI0_TRIV3|nr:hypothetical protein TVAGG3_0675370 [Trichomonas vaginalis G3]EAY08263.1 hypothetical protein TVAG_404310 [Trichomonas vaginalis G3]KAI5507495.1 hypothetical protein TVAGG3_0675370 [Trichomonas vaginalis G3]|eukprot:XP_001320486.1 hypothetical protein [Trichomonas vaginalis G3]
MIRTDVEQDDQEQEYEEGTFVVNSDDDSAFFNLDFGGSSTFGKQNNNRSGTMGGFVRNDWQNRDTTIAAAAKATTDPSANCSRQCDTCMFSFLCKSSFKGLSSLGGGGFIPKLG